MQSNGETALPLVAPGIFTTPPDGQDPELLGGSCPECGKEFFPCPPRCPHCLGDVEQRNLGSRGRLYTYTTVRVKPPWGLPRPYALGYVDLNGSGLRVLGLIDAEAPEDLEIGMPLKLAVSELGVNIQGQPCLRPFFKRGADNG